MKVLYGAYTERLVKALGDEGFGGELNYADCSAHLVPHAHAMARPYQLVLGGPAAAAISAAHLGEMIGDGNLLCADVGGTSADITVVVDGVPWSRNVFEIEHDMVVHAATVNVVTLGAGGGSIIAVTPEGDIATGPDSAGAQPGPACYGDGGDRPTVTGAAAMIGILSADGLHRGRQQLRLDPRPPGLRAARHRARALRAHPLRVGDGGRERRRGPAEHRHPPRHRPPRLQPGRLWCRRAHAVAVPAGPVPRPPDRGATPSGAVQRPRPGGSRPGVHRPPRALPLLDPGAAPEIDELYRSMEAELLSAIPDLDGARLVRTFDGRFFGQSWEMPLVEAPPG